MGMSATAHIVYGFSLMDEDDEPVEWLRDVTYDEDSATIDFKEFVSKLEGITGPTGDFDGKRFDTDPEYQNSWRDYWKAEREAAAKTQLDIHIHGHHEYSKYMLVYAGSVINSEWGETKVITTETPLHWRECFVELCKKANIEFHEPPWILTASYG